MFQIPFNKLLFNCKLDNIVKDPILDGIVPRTQKHIRNQVIWGSDKITHHSTYYYSTTTKLTASRLHNWKELYLIQTATAQYHKHIPWNTHIPVNILLFNTKLDIKGNVPMLDGIVPTVRYCLLQTQYMKHIQTSQFIILQL